MTERTLVLIKPDGVSRGLCGEIISRFERKGLKLIGLKMLRADKELVRQHYAEHVDKPFFAQLALFTMSGPIVAMVLEGHNAVTVVRQTMGNTSGDFAAPGTIRGDLASGDPIRENLVHGSDSPESAAREIELFGLDTDPTRPAMSVRAVLGECVELLMNEGNRRGDLQDKIRAAMSGL